MKRNMKRVLLVLCIVTCFLTLSACSQASDKTTVDSGNIAELNEEAVNTLKEMSGYSEEDLQYHILENKANGEQAMAKGLESFLVVKDELGAFVSAEPGDVLVTKDGFRLNVKASYEKRDLKFQVNYETDGFHIEMTSMTFDPVYTTGEKLNKAMMNTLMGMGTVFIVLIFISLLINCFKYINKFEQNLAKKNAPAEPAPVISIPVEEETEELSDDLELVAVITAAIAASTGASADGLVVRSIKRAPAGKWKRA